jgi:hypothetical protein
VKDFLSFKKILFSLSVFCISGTQPLQAQAPEKLFISNAVMEVNGVQVPGLSGSQPVIPGTAGAPYQLYVSDSLTVTMVFKIKGSSSGRSDLKDSSLRLKIDYTVTYRGYENRKRVERVFYLDETRSFREKERFNLALDKYRNSIIRLEFQGQLP